DGTPGNAAAALGSITGDVKNQAGAAIAGASIATTPTTAGAQTDANGTFRLASIPVGSYQIAVSMAGYVDGKMVNVGVAAGSTTHVSITLSPIAETTGKISGAIHVRTGTTGRSAVEAGAQVCIEGSSLCSTSGQDGTFTIARVPPGPVFVS